MKTREGVALIVVLWISAILTLLVYSFLQTMMVEYSLATSLSLEKQAEQLALSGIERAAAVVAEETAPEATLAESWASSESDFRNAPLGEGFFTLLRTDSGSGTDRKYGAVDEASKIHLNRASREVLRKLPGVTDEIADSIVDWRDEDETPSSNGAESSYYLQRDPPYRCKNAPFETVEELLYVRGVTKEILYGNDRNRNGVRDPFEPQEGEFNPGLLAYVTVWSYAKNVAEDGRPAVNINMSSAADLRSRLGDVLGNAEITAIIAGRVGEFGYRSVAHLLDVPGIDKAKFRRIAGRCTILAEGDYDVPGNVNVNTAPQKVLEALPGMTSESVARILEHRGTPGADLSTVGWLVDVLSKDEMKAVFNHVTTRSHQFRFDSTGVVSPEGWTASRPRPFRRILAVLDRLQDPPRLVYWKDWSAFGVPFEIEEEE